MPSSGMASLSRRIAYSELTEYVGLRPGMGCAKWKGRNVCVMSSVAGRIYDEPRFKAEMEALSAARHSNVAHVLAYGSADSSQLPGSSIPQLFAIFENLNGPTLSSIIQR